MSPERGPSVNWHGTEGEAHALLEAIARHCACAVGEDGGLRGVCGPHRLMVEDQRALDGLLFARRTRGRWVAEEQRTDGNADRRAS